MGLSTVLGTLACVAFCCGWRVSAYSATKLCPLEIPATLQPHSRFECPIPIDDTAAQSPLRWTPWMHLPQCVNAEDVSTNKLCVYTNSQHGIGGISILTRPQLAAEATKVLDEPVAPKFALELFANTTAGRGLPYKIVDIPGKGKGVIAARKIMKYELIMADYASMVVDMTLPWAVQRLKGYRLLHIAADQLADPDRVKTLGRGNEHAADDIEDILRTNAFHTDLAGEPHMVLYPLVSKMNHNCRPNAYTKFIPESLAVTVGAAQDIQPGEEISISYLTFGKPFAERQLALKRWGFSCTCNLCSESKKERAASDKRRKKIEELREQATEAFHQAKASEAIRCTAEALQLMQKEELFPMYSEQFENMARIYWAVGDRKMAVKYARSSLDLLTEQGYIEGYSNEHVARLLYSFDQGE